MRPVRSVFPRVAVLLAAVLVLGGCAGGAPRPLPSATQLPTGVTAEIRQLRSDVADRQAQVTVRNDTAHSLEITRIRVDDARFATPARRTATGRTTTIRAGGSVDIRIDLPPMRCDAAHDGMSRVTVEYALGPSVSVAVADLPDPLAFLAPLHARDCAAQALAAVADVAVAGFTAAPAGEPGELVLAVAPTGEGRARIDAIGTTPLLQYVRGEAGPHPLGIEISGDDAAREVRIPLVPQRCDPHVVQEDKRGTVFTLHVVVDGAEAQVELPAPPELRAQLLTWVSQWCGFG